MRAAVRIQPVAHRRAKHVGVALPAVVQRRLPLHPSATQEAIGRGPTDRESRLPRRLAPGLTAAHPLQHASQGSTPVRTLHRYPLPR